MNINGNQHEHEKHALKHYHELFQQKLIKHYVLLKQASDDYKNTCK